MQWHVTFAVEGRLQAFLDEATLRRSVRALARVMGPRLVVWGLPRDHFHALVDGSRAEVGLLGRNVRFALRAVGVRLEEPHFKAIRDRDHLENVVKYVLRQARKHDACEQPALFSGGCFLDLVGARILDGFDPGHVRRHLPHFSLARHIHEVGVRAMPVALPESDLRNVGAARLIDAAAAALAVGPDLSSDAPPVVAARRAAVALGTAAKITRKELAFALDLAPQSIGRLERAQRDAKLELAVRMRVALDSVAMAVSRNRALI